MRSNTNQQYESYEFGLLIFVFVVFCVFVVFFFCFVKLDELYANILAKVIGQIFCQKTNHFIQLNVAKTLNFMRLMLHWFYISDLLYLE